MSRATGKRDGAGSFYVINRILKRVVKVPLQGRDSDDWFWFKIWQLQFQEDAGTLKQRDGDICKWNYAKDGRTPRCELHVSGLQKVQKVWF